jgi:glycosyltransferase involved in cell wall biosynthesis
MSDEIHRINGADMPVLAVVVPCYNEEPVIKETARQLLAIINELKTKARIQPLSFIYFVDDGSRDTTWDIISEMHEQENSIKGLKLALNAGHQYALLAGLLNLYKKADCVITIDADLQDDVSVINDMVDQFYMGYDIVYGVRKERHQDSFFKKYSAQFFYKLMQRMGVNIVYNHADYRLTSKRVLENLSEFKEVNLFLRGIFPLIGFKSTTVYYNRIKRFAGESKYPLRKMLSFALNGITSFSVTPLRIITISGFIISLISAVMSIWALVAFLRDTTFPGWASIVVPIFLLGGFQLLSIGLIGEYIGKIYKEVKSRPRYIKEMELF